MKTVKKVLFILLAISVSLVVSDPSLAAFGSQGGAGGEGGIVVVKDASGTKYEGPLTIYYDKESIDNPGYANFYFFLRLRKGWELNGFSGFADSTGLEICKNYGPLLDENGEPIVDENGDVIMVEIPGILLDQECIQDTITVFVESKVIPILYPDGSAPPFELKAVDQIVEDQAGPCCEFFFTILDVTIAVQD